MKIESQKIVLLGGGYVSVWAYRALERSLKNEIANGAVEIIVVSPDPCHVFHGWTAESLTAIIREENRMSPLRDIMTHARIISGRATEIKPICRQVLVTCNDGTSQAISYDQLLFGTGSFDSDHVEGMKEFGY